MSFHDWLIRVGDQVGAALYCWAEKLFAESAPAERALRRAVWWRNGLLAAGLFCSTVVYALQCDRELTEEHGRRALAAIGRIARAQGQFIQRTYTMPDARRQKYFAAAERISAQVGVSHAAVMRELAEGAARALVSDDDVIKSVELAVALRRWDDDLAVHVETPPPLPGASNGVFWFGVALVALSQIKAVEVGVREAALAAGRSEKRNP